MFRTTLSGSKSDSKIEFQRVLLVELANLPLLINDLNSFTFDFFDRNVFYAIGAPNEAFET